MTKYARGGYITGDPEPITLRPEDFPLITASQVRASASVSEWLRRLNEPGGEDE